MNITWRKIKLDVEININCYSSNMIQTTFQMPVLIIVLPENRFLYLRTRVALEYISFQEALDRCILY